MSPSWKARDINDSNEQIMAGPYPALIARILASRGFIESDKVDRLLNPKIQELKDPYTLDGMQTAVDRIVAAFLKNEKICIYADFDLDGTSGLALLKSGMELMGFSEVLAYQPKRLSEGYGFHASAVEELAKQGVSLIITVDVGITAHPAVETANQLGVDVIITDHHLPADTLPPALTIVNPNKGTCSSGLGYLCGAGVAFYLLRALRRAFRDDSRLEDRPWDLKEVLDFFTIGTLTDMVPLVDDNRVLVKHGLIKLAETKRPGLLSLLKALDLTGRPLTSQDVAIRFAPKLNALSRMESGVLPIDIFLETDHQKAEDIVEFVLENNSNRVQLQSDAENEAMALLKSWPHKDFVFVASTQFHRGVVGLIATKLSQSFNKPAFVGSISSDGSLVGSARVPNGSEICLVEALTSAEKVLNRFGGHSAAAGFETHAPRMNDVIDCLVDYFTNLESKPKKLEVLYDSEAELAEVNSTLMKWYDFVGPFGAGFEVPVLRFGKVQLVNKKELRGGHYRLKLSSPLNSSLVIEALLFSPIARQVEVINSGALLFDILGELQWNYFGGKESIQLLVKDIRIAEA